MTFRLRPAAEADIEDIALFVAADDPRAARHWLDDIYARCRHIGELPGLGVARPDVRPGLRLLPVGSYLILYERVDAGVDIIRVLHGARQWQVLFDG